MEKLSDATVIVERMLVRYLGALTDDRADLLGSEEAKEAWKLLRQELENHDLEFLAEEFEEHPEKVQRKVVMVLTKYMNRDPGLAGKLQQLYDKYLIEMYSEKIQIEQNFGQVINVAGATKGGSVIGIDIDQLGEEDSDE